MATANVSPTKAKGKKTVEIDPTLLVGTLGKSLLLLYILAVTGIAAYFVFALWPVTSAAPDGKTITTTAGLFGHIIVFNDAVVLLLVMVLGVIGSCIHTATSLIDFAGKKTLERSWIPWYILRPFIGALLALVLFFTLKAGLLALGTDTENINYFTIAAISALAGMFSKQATSKLSEVFDTVFKTKTGDGAADTDNSVHPLPEIVNLDPAEIVNSQDVNINIIGHNFVKESVVYVNGEVADRIFKDSENIQLELKTDKLKTLGNPQIKIKILNPPPGGGETEEKVVTVKP